jgi:hypothetical protein
MVRDQGCCSCIKVSTIVIPLSWIFPENLDKIQNLVEDKFQDIRNTDRSSLHCPGQPCALEHLQVCLLVVNILQAETKGCMC